MYGEGQMASFAREEDGVAVAPLDLALQALSSAVSDLDERVALLDKRLGSVMTPANIGMVEDAPMPRPGAESAVVTMIRLQAERIMNQTAKLTSLMYRLEL